MQFKENVMSYLVNINSPEDVKKLNLQEMDALAGEIRAAILNRDSKIGGHVGPNLGIVEATIALHYVFDSPKDKIVFDVSHQCYPHKLLTGRKAGFLTKEGMEKISGYTNPSESEHDHFVVGHTSTSVSLACGLAKARNIRGENHNVIAVLGDGSLSGGEALEGLSNAAVLNSNIIVLLNDNEINTVVLTVPNYLHKEMRRGSKETGVKRIRIHDIRHSHVSLLIEMGFSAVAIADRVGHESIDITYRYAHLFPSKQREIADKLKMEG